jgi:hypothetical protein
VYIPPESMPGHTVKTEVKSRKAIVPAFTFRSDNNITLEVIKYQYDDRNIYYSEENIDNFVEFLINCVPSDFAEKVLNKFAHAMIHYGYKIKNCPPK